MKKSYIRRSYEGKATSMKIIIEASTSVKTIAVGGVPRQPLCKIINEWLSHDTYRSYTYITRNVSWIRTHTVGNAQSRKEIDINLMTCKPL